VPSAPRLGAQALAGLRDMCPARRHPHLPRSARPGGGGTAWSGHVARDVAPLVEIVSRTRRSSGTSSAWASAATVRPRLEVGCAATAAACLVRPCGLDRVASGPRRVSVWSVGRLSCRGRRPRPATAATTARAPDRTPPVRALGVEAAPAPGRRRPGEHADSATTTGALLPAVHGQGEQVGSVLEVADDDAALLP
jgi:hypothetical protein